MQQSVRSRRRLDARLSDLQPASRYTPPSTGWIRAVRDALGMSQADLAGRLGIAAQSVQGLEETERSGAIRLESLRRVAEAMDCTVVYVLLPRTSLEETVIAQATAVLGDEMSAAERSMALEAQDTTLLPATVRAMVDRLVESRRLWRR